NLQPIHVKKRAFHKPIEARLSSPKPAPVSASPCDFRDNGLPLSNNMRGAPPNRRSQGRKCDDENWVLVDCLCVVGGIGMCNRWVSVPSCISGHQKLSRL